MGSTGKQNTPPATTQKLPSDYIKSYWGGMKSYDIDGVTVTTNFKGNYPLMGRRAKMPAKYYGSSAVSSGYRDMTNPTEAFNTLVRRGYNLIRFVEYSTRVKGYHDVYVWYGRQ